MNKERLLKAVQCNTGKTTDQLLADAEAALIEYISVYAQLEEEYEALKARYERDCK